MSVLPNYSNIITASANGKNLEIEVKFGKYYGQDFVATLGRQVFFQRAFEYLKKKGNGLSTSVYKDRRWDDGLRHRTNVDTNQEDWITKKRAVDHLEMRDYDLRLSMSYEIPSVPRENPIPDLYRDITRYSTDVGDFRIDLSTVKSKYVQKPGKKPKKDTTTFELEVEIIDSSNINNSLLKEFDQLLVELFCVVKNTDNLYTTLEIESLNRMVNRALGMNIIPPDSRHGSEKFDIYRQYFNDARNLRKYDMVDGGLVGKKNQMYYVTDKADGERKLLCFNEIGMWIIFTGSFNLIRRENLSIMKEYILEGEYIPRNEIHRLRGSDGIFIEPGHAKRHVMYIYDAISVKDIGYSIQNDKHSKRMDEVDKFIDALPDFPDLFLQRKDFLGLTYETMYNAIKWMLNKDTPYLTDGLMFIPDSSPYDIWRDYKLDKMRENANRMSGRRGEDNDIAILPPLKTRNLKDNDDICKWKKPSQITIDLKVVFNDKNPGVVELWTEKIRTPVEFKGSDWYPLTWENGLNPNDSVLYPGGIRIESGTIVECSYSDAKDEETDKQAEKSKYQLTAVRIRSDKSHPNQQDVVLDNWTLSHDSLPLYTMKGEGTILMHFYHNDIKRELFSRMPAGSTILDIGSGRGADLSKWDHLGHVFAVEPYSGWIEIFKSRLSGSRNRNKVQLIETGAEDVDKIIDIVRSTKGRVDYVTFMLSLTFFWQSETMLKNIAYLIQETLKPGGKVIFLTMDGDVVNSYFYPPFGSNDKNIEFKTDYIYLRPKDDHFYIDIKGSNVRDQEEYAAVLSDLATLLGGTLNKIRADKRSILNPSETILSNMYSYGEITIGSEIQRITKPERAINKMSFPNQQPQSVTNTQGTPVSVETLYNAFGQMSMNQPPVQNTPTSVRVMLTNEPIEKIAFDSQYSFYRVRTIGDGSCYVNAFLQGFSRTYNNPNVNPTDKANMVYSFRQDLANFLLINSKGMSNWALYGDGKWAVAFTAQLAEAQEACNARMLNPDSPPDLTIDPVTRKPFKDPRVFKYHGIDNSELGITNYLKARGAYLDYNTFDLVSEFIGIDVYVFELHTNSSEFRYTTAIEGRKRNAVLIGGVRGSANSKRVNHFETLGMEYKNPNGEDVLVTIINNDSPILAAYPKKDPSIAYDDSKAMARFSSIAAPQILEILTRVAGMKTTPGGDNLSVFKFHRQYFSKTYEYLITSALRQLGAPESLWPSVPQPQFVPPCFESQNKVRAALGLPTTTKEITLQPIGIHSLSTQSSIVPNFAVPIPTTSTGSGLSPITTLPTIGGTSTFGTLPPLNIPQF